MTIGHPKPFCEDFRVFISFIYERHLPIAHMFQHICDWKIQGTFLRIKANEIMSFVSIISFLERGNFICIPIHLSMFSFGKKHSRATWGIKGGGSDNGLTLIQCLGNLVSECRIWIVTTHEGGYIR